jgi:7-cyano-7-deazaguanine synthase
VEGAGIQVHAPLQFLSKGQIVSEGVRLGVDFGLTVSCYNADANGAACGHCDACRLRAQGFAFAHLGPRVLRSETAVIAALAVVRAKLGLL